MVSATDALKDSPFQAVQVEALVIMKITKHCSSTFPTTATGSIVGMQNGSALEITNTFAFPAQDAASLDGATSSNDRGHQNDASALAAAAPRSKANIAYQAEMIHHLKEVNVDANNVGFYTSATMGNFVTMSLVENLYHYQRDATTGESKVALVYDVSRSSQGALNLRAFRLTNTFLAAYKEGKFTTEKYVFFFFLSFSFVSSFLSCLPSLPPSSPLTLFAASKKQSSRTRTSWSSCPSRCTTRTS